MPGFQYDGAQAEPTLSMPVLLPSIVLAERSWIVNFRFWITVLKVKVTSW